MLELKTTPPALRPGLVVRRGLLRRLETTTAPAVVLAAPAGYGKTTVLSQFAGRTRRPLAWLNLDEGDGDPTVLISALAHSLARCGLLQENEWKAAAVESSSVLTRGVEHLLESVDTDAGGVLILDHLDALPTRSSLDVIGAAMARSRGRLRVMVASRSYVGLPMGLLRAHGDLLELTTEDLALDASEASEMFEAVGVPGTVQIDRIVRRTEGWPAAVYLTALAMKAGAPAPDDGQVRGDDAYLAEYFREELMEGIPDRLESFLLRSSILPRMSGDLCDYVLEIEESAVTLDQLQKSNLMVVPMDRARTWFRYHSLLQDFLRSRLHSEFPDEEQRLHRRASEWFEKEGLDELAIDHARRAVDFDRVATLLARLARSFYATGRNETLFAWLDLLEESEVLREHPEVAAVGGFARALGGDPGGAERMALNAYDDSNGHPRDESELGPLTLMFRSYQAPNGADRAVVDAQRANEVLSHHSDWAHVALGALALATYATEGAEAADPLWADGLWRAESIEAGPFAVVARAMRGMAAIRRGEWDAAEETVSRAIAHIERDRLETYVTSALAYIQAARIAVYSGDLERGRFFIARSARIRPLLTVAVPIYSVLTLHEQADAYLAFADVAGARRLMRDAADILAIRPRLGILVQEHEDMKSRLAALPAGTVGPSSLTGAELRLLPLLVTHLTYPEIGDRLYVSKHTVKTQAMSIYRKLGVSSRTGAVERAREIGLIST